jgi:ribosomal protein L11 methyltransferase
MSNDWVDVQIQSSLDAGELLNLLDDSSVPGAWQEGRTIHLYWPSHRWSPDHLSRLRETLRRVAEEDPPDIVVQSLTDRDWNRQWAETVKPLLIGKRIVVRPSWERPSLEAGRIEIILDPKQAFGTGHHATTSLLLEWLEEEISENRSVLDVGTGSGLLAMVALRLGASRAVAVDHDPVAIDCAKEYAAMNGFGPELTLRCGAFVADGCYDVVLANLDRRTLLSLAQPLAESTRGTLLVSGLLVDQAGDIVSAFAEAGLYCGCQRERDGWLALAFTPAESCEGA